MFLDVFTRESTIQLYAVVLMLHIAVLFPRYVEKGHIAFDKHLSDYFPFFFPNQYFIIFIGARSRCLLCTSNTNLKFN